MKPSAATPFEATDDMFIDPSKCNDIHTGKLLIIMGTGMNGKGIAWVQVVMSVLDSYTHVQS